MTKHQNETFKSDIKSVIIGVLIATLFFLCTKVLSNWFDNPVIVSGNSMFPTYKNDDILRATKKFTKDSLSCGDVVVFKIGFKQYIKRIIATPGDTITVENGQFVVNDIVIDEPLCDLMEDAGILDNTTITLADDEFFCAGDNRNNSNDCRAFGPIKFENIRLLVKSYWNEKS